MSCRCFALVLCGARRANAELMLDALQLTSWFEALVLGEECERAKPHPDPYQEGLRLMGLTAAETVVVEDSPSGEAGAQPMDRPCIKRLLRGAL